LQVLVRCWFTVGLQAIQTIKDSGRLSLFMIGVVVTVVPLVLSMLFARYVLAL
jgi:uncharacterized transporter YbjL